MTDLSRLSDEDILKGMRGNSPPPPDMSGLSDEALLQLIQAMPASSAQSPVAGPTAGEMALEDMPAWQRVAAGAGKAAMDSWHGAKQLGAEVGNWISPALVSDGTVARLRGEADETAARDEALMNDPYGLGGNIGGHVVMGAALPASRIPTAIGSASAYGAVQPVGAKDSRIDNTVAGAALGGAGAAGAHVVGRLLSPVRNAAAPGTQALIREAEEEGYRFSAGQATGNRHVQNAEGALETLPTGGSHLRNLDEANQVHTNRIVAGEMGEQVDAITPEVIEAARTRIGAVMDDPSHGRPLNVDKKFFDEIYRIRAQYGQTLTAQQSGEIRSLLDELASGGRTRGPRISGEQYQRTVSALRQEAEASFRSGTKVNDAGVKREIAEALEGLAERNLSGEELDAFNQARRQYSATLIAEKAVRTDGSGNIRIEALDAATKRHRRIAHRQGTEDRLVRLGRVGQHLKKVRIPNSGTAERSWWLKAAQSPLTMGAGAGAAGGYVGAGGDPTHLLGLAAPFFLGRGMYSNMGQNWLRHGLQFPGRDLTINALTRLAPGATAGTSQALNNR